MTSVLDLSGLHCPQVVLRLADHVRGLAPGSTVSVLSTDRLSVIDIPCFVHRNGHRLLREERVAGGFRFLVQRGAGTAAPDAGDPRDEA